MVSGNVCDNNIWIWNNIKISPPVKPNVAATPNYSYLVNFAMLATIMTKMTEAIMYTAMMTAVRAILTILRELLPVTAFRHIHISRYKIKIYSPLQYSTWIGTHAIIPNCINCLLSVFISDNCCYGDRSLLTHGGRVTIIYVETICSAMIS